MNDSYIVANMWFMGAVLANGIGVRATCLLVGLLTVGMDMFFNWLASDMKKTMRDAFNQRNK